MFTKHTELSLRTGFILNPAKLLNEIADAVLHEEQEDARALLTLVMKHDYISLIFDLLQNTEISDQILDLALWTASLLSVSDNATIRAAVRTATTNDLVTRIVRLLFNADGAWKDKSYGNKVGCRSAAYLVRNLVRHDDHRINCALSDALSVLPEEMPENAMSDCFFAIADLIRNENPLTASLVSRFLATKVSADFSKRTTDAMVYCLGALCEVNGAIGVGNYAEVLTLFERLFNAGGTPSELLWALSNFMCEAVVAERAARSIGNVYDSFYNLFHTHVIGGATEKQVKNSLWVIVNCLANIRNDAVKRLVVDPADGHYRAMWEFLEAEAPYYTIAQEGLDYLDQWQEKFYPEDSESDMDTDSDSDSDSDTDTDEEEAAAAPINSCEHQAEAEVPESAFQLLGASLPAPSEAVRHLISELKKSGIWGWVSITDNTIFSAADLRWMEGSGYIVSQGYFGIAPWLRSGY
jgi:hypothetical protein